MANGHALAANPGFFREKILLGMGTREYIRSCCTPFNAVAAIILAVGVPLLVVRFAVGLGATTNLTQTAPWGIWIGFDMMTGIVLAAGGFTIGATVQIFGLKEYHPIERPACPRTSARRSLSQTSPNAIITMPSGTSVA